MILSRRDALRMRYADAHQLLAYPGLDTAYVTQRKTPSRAIGNERLKARAATRTLR
jgi:hypothetical protein